MTIFSAATGNEAVVPADRQAIWDVLTNPGLVAELTPLLRRIDADGDLWTWHMVRISALGVGITPTFTERMTFQDGRRIDYVHEPPEGVTERTGACGFYEMEDVPGGTGLKISLTLDADLPLPKRAAPAVTRIMTTMIRRTGDKFSENLYRHLGIGDGIGDQYERVSA